VIQLCQESVNPAERNSVLFNANGEPKSSRISEKAQFSGRHWRSYLICKAYFHWGKLDEALDLLKKHEQVTPVKERFICHILSLHFLCFGVFEL
jgi:DnaJ family protein C protein 7